MTAIPFNVNEHQKVRYNGGLFVVVLTDNDDYYQLSQDVIVEIHPINRENIIIYNTNPAIITRVPKSALHDVGHLIID